MDKCPGYCPNYYAGLSTSRLMLTIAFALLAMAFLA